MSAPDAARAVQLRSLPAAASPSLASSRKKSRIARYLIERGWVHLVLLTGIAVFLFPFAYMLGTSLKTDEELTASNWFPAVPGFRSASPYVRDVATVARPPEAPRDKWERLLPRF